MASPSEVEINVTEVKKSHTFDYIIVFDQEASEPVDDDDGGTSCFGLINDGTKRTIRTDRGRILHRLRSVGLMCTLFKARNGKEYFLGLNATERRMMEHAERMELRLRLKPEYGGGYTEFEVEKAEYFQRHSVEHFFRSSLRCHIILNLIEAKKIDGGAALSIGILQKEGIIKTMFPVHEEAPRQELVQTWAKNWRTQPLDEIRDYFGEKVALYFAWLGFYTSWLILASIVGFIVFIVSEREDFDHPIVPFYCIFLSVWSTLFLEFWKRRNAALAFNWGTMGFESEERTRPEFRGTEKRGVYVDGEWVDLSDEAKWGAKAPVSLYHPTLIRWFKMSIGTPAIMTMVGIVIAATVGLMITRSILQRDLKDPFWGGQLSGIINAIAIIILNLVYRNIAVSITDWENHRTDTEYEDNLVAKTFMFQFVNSYISLFYIAFLKESGTIGNDSCEENCMKELTSQLSSILIFRQIFGQFQEILMPIIIAKVNAFLEAHKLKEHDTTPKNMSRYERQALMPAYTTTFDDYNEMIIQYGYVTLFAAAFPLAPLIALLNNIVEIRTDAMKMLKETRRPEYQAAEDIGTWYKILEIIGIFAVVTNALVISQTSEQLEELMDENDGKKVLFVAVAIEHAILILKFVIAWLIPDVPGWVRKELAVQEYAKSRIINDRAQKDVTQDDFSDDADSDNLSEISDMDADLEM
eukprot:TRINITY_DN1177_c0_g1_i1.p1 TRINITY_DN1177_c0_g1~~TRINITY_DN1177_c0_g1_i1.p1  ORF type:complete len:696 (+),score=177.06 TRINITY_DN1177_c0_g1_i1:52-2139(+)